MRHPIRRIAVLAGLVALVGLAAPAAAHGRSVGRSVITLDDDGRGAELRLAISRLDRDALYAAHGGHAHLAAALTGGLYLAGPDGRCVATAPSELPAATGQVAYRWRVRCPGPPTRLGCDLLVDVVPGHVHLTRVVARGADVVIALAADRRTADLVGAADSAAGPMRFLRMGLEHVAGGVDHLLFLLTLLLVAGSLRELALAATGFTLGHSVALLLSVALAVRPAAAGIELLVAASIAIVAAEAAAARAQRRDAAVPVAVAVVLLAIAALVAVTGGPAPLALVGLAGLAACYLALAGVRPGGSARLVVTVLFGLIHGFAFAGPLADLALDGRALAAALIAFNAGIELAQLVVLASGWWLLAALRRRAPTTAALAVDVAAAAAVTPAVYWMIVRAR